MARTINFVRERRRNLTRQEQDDRKILKFTTFGLFGLGAVILVIVAARLFLLYQIKTVQDKQERVQSAIMEKVEIEEQYTIFANKLNILTELFGKRREKQEALAYFSSLFGSDVIINQLSYTAGDEVLSFVLQTTSIFTMEQVFNVISSDQVTARYPTIKKQSLRRSLDGSYGMQVTLYFGDEPLEVPPVEGEVLDDGTGLVDPTVEGETEAAPAAESET